MHPRQALRHEITEIVRAALPGAVVDSGLARDIPASASLSAIIYTPNESISTTQNGEGARGRTVTRTMTVEILILATASGDGEDVLAAVDDASRAVEVAINAATSNADLVSVVTDVMAAERTGATAQMTYTVEHLDTFPEIDAA